MPGAAAAPGGREEHLASPPVLPDWRDPAFVADPYPALAVLREAGPLHEEPGTGRWFATRVEDVRRCLRDRRLGRGPDPRIGRFEGDPRWAAFWEVEERSLLWLEPPDHDRLRALVSAAFTNRSVEALRPHARALVASLLDDLARRPSFDLLADLAQPYAIGVVGRLLGVPPADHDRLLRWSHRMVRMYELDVPEADARAATDAATELRAYVLDLVAARRAEPADDLVTRLVHASVDGSSLTDAELVSTIVLLLNAGHEATVNGLGNGVAALLERPDQWERLTSGVVPARVAVEELLRFDSPLQLFERWVLDPDGVEVAGRRLPFGAQVAMLFGAADRDPRAFADPDALDVGRDPNPHITFGGGVHHCLGAPLARLELDESLAALAARLPGLALVAPPVRVPAFVIRGYQAVEVAP